MPSYFDQVKPTYIENWPAGLLNHSVATVHFPLAPAQVDGLIALSLSIESDIMPKAKDYEAVDNLVQTIDKYISQFPNGAFIRLGSRSPKDSYTGYREGFRCLSGKHAIELLRDSERISDDLHLARGNGYTPHMVVREWLDIEPWQEFRCFYRGRKLVGISQYNYLKNVAYPEIAELADAIEWAIRKKSEIVASLLPADNVIVDYVYRVRQRGNERISEVILLECNPFMVYTDPCLFNWSRDDFAEFEFKYLNFPMARGASRQVKTKQERGNAS